MLEPPSLPVHEDDVCGLVRLFGQAAALGSRAERIDFVLGGLCAMIGAERWSLTDASAASDRCPAAASHHSPGPAKRPRTPPGGSPPLPPAASALGLAPREAEAAACRVVFHRGAHAPPFTARELRLADIALREAPWLLATEADLAHSRGALADLPARERTALRFLLAGSARKDIASRMNISPHTAAGYVKALYKRFGVRSQRELMRAPLKTPALALLLGLTVGGGGFFG